jgi:hypothetical protein
VSSEVVARLQRIGTKNGQALSQLLGRLSRLVAKRKALTYGERKMSWFSKMLGTSLRLDNLENLLKTQLEDLYSAEDQLIETPPKMADAASSQELKSAFQTHLE